MNRFTIPDQFINKRLDKFLQDNFGLQWNTIQKVLRNKKVFIKCLENKNHSCPSYKIKKEDSIFYDKQLAVEKKNIKKEEIPLIKQENQGFMKSYYEYDFFKSMIIYENKNIIIINKKSNMTSQGGQIKNEKYNIYPLLRNYLVFKELMKQDENICLMKEGKNNQILNERMIKKLREYLNERNIFIVHRLDKNTSGNLMICKNKQSAQKISQLFVENKDIEKYYIAIVSGEVKEKKGVIQVHLDYDNGRNKAKVDYSRTTNCATFYQTLQVYHYHQDHTLLYHQTPTSQSFSLLKIRLVAGKKHQIRAHLSQVLETPVIFDTKYGFLSNNSPFLNNMLFDFYKSEEYQQFKQNVYHRLTQNQTYISINSKKQESQYKSDEQYKDIYVDFDNYCIKEKEVMGLHSYQLILKMMDNKIFTDENTETIIEIESQMSAFLLYFIYKSNNGDIEKVRDIIKEIKGIRIKDERVRIKDENIKQGLII